MVVAFFFTGNYLQGFVDRAGDRFPRSKDIVLIARELTNLLQSKSATTYVG